MKQKRNNTITITWEDFAKAVDDANEKFRNITDENGDNVEERFTGVLMGLQNVIFAHMIADELFAENVSSEDTENTENTINA